MMEMKNMIGKSKRKLEKVNEHRWGTHMAGRKREVDATLKLKIVMK